MEVSGFFATFIYCTFHFLLSFCFVILSPHHTLYETIR